MHTFRLLFVLSFSVIIFAVSCSDRRSVAPTQSSDEVSVAIAFGDTIPVPGTGISVVFKRIVSDQRLTEADYALWPWLYNTAIVEVILLPENKHVHLTISGDLDTSVKMQFVSEEVVVDTFSLEPVSLLPLPEKNGRLPDSVYHLRFLAKKISNGLIEHSDYLPLKIGNRWVYLDSMFSEGSFESAQMRTVTVIGDYYDALGHWYYVDDGFTGIPQTLLASHDTLYSRAEGGINQPVGRIAGRKNIEFAPMDDDGFNLITQAVFGDILFSRSVYQCDSTITTPAGSFHVPFRYSGSAYISAIEYYYTPEIGIIFSEAGSWSGAYVLRSILMETDFH